MAEMVRHEVVMVMKYHWLLMGCAGMFLSGLAGVLLGALLTSA